MLCVIDRCVHQKDGEVLTQVWRWTVLRSLIFFFTVVDLANLFLAESPMIPPSPFHFFPPCNKVMRHISAGSRQANASVICLPLANTRDTSQVAKMVSQDGIEFSTRTSGNHSSVILHLLTPSGLTDPAVQYCDKLRRSAPPSFS